MRRIFISHSSSDHALASLLGDMLRGVLPSVDVFVASQPGNIATGDKWLDTIERKLITGSIYLILLTPASIERHWVWFEVGSFWFLGRKILPVCAGLQKSDIPFPLGSRQALSIEDPAELAILFRDVGAECPDPTGMAKRLQAVALMQTASPHVICDGRMFVWSGPLSKLEDWQPVDPPPRLSDALGAAGLKVRHEPPSTTGLILAEGWGPVFESDGRKWKRPVRCPQLPDQWLLVKPRD